MSSNLRCGVLAMACATIGFFGGVLFTEKGGAESLSEAGETTARDATAITRSSSQVRANSEARERVVIQKDAERSSRDDAYTPQRAADTPSTLDKTCREATAIVEKERDQCLRDQARHKELSGAPIDAPRDIPSRLSQSALTSAFTTAFVQTGVPGKLDSIDCTEYPCIVFSSVVGDEEVAEKLEHAKVLRAYDEDFGTMLMWATTDEQAERHPSQPKPPERTLVAISWVTRAQREAAGSNLDRRIRSRVAEYWNATRPGEQP